MSKPKKLRKLIKAAKMGNLHAIYRLALCYESGKLGEIDLPIAAMLMEIAAEEGYAPAVAWLEDYTFDDNAAVQAEV